MKKTMAHRERNLLVVRLTCANLIVESIFLSNVTHVKFFALFEGGNVPPPPMQTRKDSLGMGFADLDNLMQQRRNSSLGLSMLNDDMNRRSSLGSLGPGLGMDNSGGEPPHRPYVGGGAGAAFEAARADHYAQKREEQQRRASGLGLGAMGGGPANMPQMGLSVNPNQ